MVIFLCSMFGVVIVSMVVVTVINLFEMSKLESKAFTIINKLTTKKIMKEKAALIIQRVMRLHLKIKKFSKKIFYRNFQIF